MSIECLQGLTNVSNESPLCFARIEIERCWVSHRSDIAYPGPDINWLYDGIWHSLKQHLLSALMPSLGPKGQQLYAVNCCELCWATSWEFTSCATWFVQFDVLLKVNSWEAGCAMFRKLLEHAHQFHRRMLGVMLPSLLVFSVLWASFGASKVIPPANTLGLGQNQNNT